MKKWIGLGVVLFFVFNASGNVLLNHLEKLYQKDQSKCMERSKWFMKHFKDRAEPYYFAFKVQESRVASAKNNISAFYRTKTALKYALGFQERADEELITEINWNSESVQFCEDVRALILRLESENEERYADMLAARFEKFDRFESTENVVVEIKNVRDENVTNTVFEASTSKMMFNMPTGHEIIPSTSMASEVELLEIINAERKKKGLKELIWNEELANAARYHAFDLGSQDYFNHDTYDRVDGNLVRVGNTFERIRKFYTESHVNAENIAAGDSRASGTYNQWYTSKGHYETMFNPDSEKVGIGYVKVPGSTYAHYWVLCTAE